MVNSGEFRLRFRRTLIVSFEYTQLLHSGIVRKGDLTSDEAAAHLGITRRTLWNLMRREGNGFPQPRKVGRTLLWRTTQLDAWRAKHPARRRATQPTTPIPGPTTAPEATEGTGSIDNT